MFFNYKIKEGYWNKNWPTADLADELIYYKQVSQKFHFSLMILNPFLVLYSVYLPGASYNFLYKAFRVVCPANLPNTSGGGEHVLLY